MLAAFPVDANNVIHFKRSRDRDAQKVLKLFSRFSLVNEKCALIDGVVYRDRFDTLRCPYNYTAAVSQGSGRAPEWAPRPAPRPVAVSTAQTRGWCDPRRSNETATSR